MALEPDRSWLAASPPGVERHAEGGVLLGQPSEDLGDLLGAVVFSVTISRMGFEPPAGRSPAEWRLGAREGSRGSATPRGSAPSAARLGSWLVKVLVTGGAGFIGSHLVDALVARGDEVLVLDDLSSGKRENLAGRSKRARRWISSTSPTRAMLDAVERVQARGRLPPRRPDRRAPLDGRPGLRRADQRGRHGERARGGRGAPGAANSSSPPPAAPSTARATSAATSCPSPRTRAASRSRSTARASSPPRATSTLYAAHARALRRPRCASEYLRAAPGPGDARRAWSRSSAGLAGRRPADRLRHGEQTRDYIMSGTSWRRWSPRSEARPPGPIKSAPESRRACSSWSSCIGAASGREDFEPEFAPARAGEVQRTASTPAAAARRARARTGASADRSGHRADGPDRRRPVSRSNLAHARPGLRRQGVRLPAPQGDLRPVAACATCSRRPLHRLPEAEGPALPGGRRRRHRPREGRGAARLRRRRDADRPRGAPGAGRLRERGLDPLGAARATPARRPRGRASW